MVTKVAIIDRHPVVRFAVQTLVTQIEKMEFVGEAEGVEEALNLIENVAPDVVILDLYLKQGADGIELCRQLKASSMPPKILVYSAYTSGEEVSSALLAGAESYLYKGVGTLELQRALLDTSEGKRVWKLDPGEGEAECRARVLASSCYSLTPRESEIFSLMLRHYSNLEIARELCVGLPTVKTHVSNVLRKLGVSNRREIH